MARALEVVRIRQARERAQDRRLADLAAQVAALRDALAGQAPAPNAAPLRT